jgi:hypothetical protein
MVKKTKRSNIYTQSQVKKLNEKHPLSQPEKKNFRLGNAVKPKIVKSRFVRFPRYVQLQRKKRILLRRLKCPPAIAQFFSPLDKPTTNKVINILKKYSPETRKEKKERLKKIAENEKGDLQIHKWKNKYYINGKILRQTIENLFYSFNYYGIKLELRDNNNYYPHWGKDLIYNDYMKSNFDSDSTITHFTISLLQDLGWYSFKYKSCNLYSYQNDEYCVLFKNKCIEKYNHNIHYYIQNGVLRCFLNMKYLKKSFCIPEENIQKEYKRKILDKKKINIYNKKYKN